MSRNEFGQPLDLVTQLMLRRHRHPDAVAELTLLLAGTAYRRSRAEKRIVALSRAVDYASLVRRWDTMRMLPLLGSRLIEVVGEGVAPAFRERVAETIGRERRRALLFEAMTQRIVRTLETCGIPTMPLKGVTLAKALYGESAMRSSSDIDLLVEARNLFPAVDRISHRLGYVLQEEPLHRGLPRLHCQLTHSAAALPPIEVHWRLHWYEQRFAAELLREHATADDEVKRPPPAYQLLALLLYYARDGFTGLRLATDIATWWDKNETNFDPQKFADLLVQHPALHPAARAAAVTAYQLVGAPPLATTFPSETRERSIRLANHLNNWAVTGDRDAISANISLIDGLLTPRGRAGQFVRRHILPPAAVLHDYYDIEEGQWGRTNFWRLAHPPKMLTRYALSLWSVRSGRRWAPLPAPNGAWEANRLGRWAAEAGTG